MSEKQTSTESSHDEQTTKDSDGELKQDPSELPLYDDDDDDMSKKQTSTESSHDEQTTKDSDGELMQDPSELPLYDEMSKKQTSTESSHDEQTTKDSDGELMQDPSELTPYDVSPSADNSELPPHDEMSKKQTSTESNHDEQTTKDSGGELIQAVFQNEEDNTKREILASLSDTTLEDLPMELIVRILVKAVAMEVKGLRLVKRLWKERADLVISRLRTVSLQWSSVLSIDFFRNELHRTLDGFAQEALRWEVVLHQPPIQSDIYNLTTMRDEIFMLFPQHGGRYVLNVYDRNNVAKPKEAIPIPEFNRGHTCMAACRVSNCVYLLNEDKLDGLSVIRVRKDKHQFKASTWIRHLKLPKSEGYLDSRGLSVSAQGNLIIVSKPKKPTPTVVGIYDANGFAKHKITLSSDTYEPAYVSNVIQKADGNLMVSCLDYEANLKLLEIDTSGGIIREYQSSHFDYRVECFEDIYGRILVNNCGYNIVLLDAEFNFMDTVFPLLDARRSYYRLHYDSERHEMVGFRFDDDWCTDTESCVFLTIRFN